MDSYIPHELYHIQVFVEGVIVHEAEWLQLLRLKVELLMQVLIQIPCKVAKLALELADVMLKEILKYLLPLSLSATRISNQASSASKDENWRIASKS